MKTPAVLSAVYLFPAILLMIAAGCSNEPVPITGGTIGSLTSDGKAMSQMQVNVFDDIAAPMPIGRGYVNSDGSFSLVAQDGLQALELPAGKYFATIESVGAEVKIPQQYTQPNTTPLVITHQNGSAIRLDVPNLSRGM